MTKDSVAPVVAGFAVGICFVIVMSVSVDSMKPVAVNYGNRTPIHIPEGQSYDILSEEEVIRIALNVSGHDMESMNEAWNITLAQYYLDDADKVYERNIQTGEKTILAEDDTGLSRLDKMGEIDKPMHYWGVTLEFSQTDVHWILINASNGNVVQHFAT
ncbi:MAG: hypothetical protein AB1351_04585 [Thermoproteota archaeon]